MTKEEIKINKTDGLCNYPECKNKRTKQMILDRFGRADQFKLDPISNDFYMATKKIIIIDMCDEHEFWLDSFTDEYGWDILKDRQEIVTKCHGVKDTE